MNILLRYDRVLMSYDFINALYMILEDDISKSIAILKRDGTEIDRSLAIKIYDVTNNSVIDSSIETIYSLWISRGYDGTLDISCCSLLCYDECNRCNDNVIKNKNNNAIFYLNNDNIEFIILLLNRLKSPDHRYRLSKPALYYQVTTYPHTFQQR